MGVFGDIWEWIKKAARSVVNFFKKLFSVCFKGVRMVIEGIFKAASSLLKHNWVGLLITGVEFINDLVQFFQSKGANVNESYRYQLQDMDLNNYSEHQINIDVSA